MNCIGSKCKYFSKSYSNSHNISAMCLLFDKLVYVDTSPYRDKNKINVKTECHVINKIKQCEQSLQNYTEFLDELKSK